MACPKRLRSVVGVCVGACVGFVASCTREPTRHRPSSSRSPATAASPAAWGDAGVPNFASPASVLGAPLGSPPAPTGRWALELRNYNHGFLGMERTFDVTTHAVVILDLAADGAATGCFGERSKHASSASPYVTPDKKWEHSEYENQSGTTQHGSWRMDGPWLELRFDSFSHGCPAVQRPSSTPISADAGPPERFPNTTPWVVRCATVPARAPAPAFVLACALPTPSLWQALAIAIGPARAPWLLLGPGPGLLVDRRATEWLPQPPKEEALLLTTPVAPISPDAWSKP